MQKERFKGQSTGMNAHMSSRQVKKYCVMDKDAEALLYQAMTELGLSARGHSKILKVGRTIADLDEKRAYKDRTYI